MTALTCVMSSQIQATYRNKVYDGLCLGRFVIIEHTSSHQHCHWHHLYSGGSNSERSKLHPSLVAFPHLKLIANEGSEVLPQTYRVRDPKAEPADLGSNKPRTIHMQLCLQSRAVTSELTLWLCFCAGPYTYQSRSLPPREIAPGFLNSTVNTQIQGQATTIIMIN